MGLFSFLRRQPDPAPRKRKAPAAAPLDPSAVEQARVRARRRLIGAAVLVLIAVIGFPLLFETTPRPVPSDLPIVIAGALIVLFSIEHIVALIRGTRVEPAWNCLSWG